MINSLDIQKGLSQQFLIPSTFSWNDRSTVLTLTMFPFDSFAYIEFTDKESVETAVTLDDSLFKGRQIKVHMNCIYF